MSAEDMEFLHHEYANSEATFIPATPKMKPAAAPMRIDDHVDFELPDVARKCLECLTLLQKQTPYWGPSKTLSLKQLFADDKQDEHDDVQSPDDVSLVGSFDQCEAIQDSDEKLDCRSPIFTALIKAASSCPIHDEPTT